MARRPGGPLSTKGGTSASNTLRTPETLHAIHQRVKAAASTIYWASCETGHAIWSGPDRDTYQKAAVDAAAHDTGVHGGVGTAVVLNTLMVLPATVVVSPSLQCLSWHAIKPFLGAIFNRCPKCMKVTLVLVDWNGGHSYREVGVPKESYKEVDYTGFQSIEIIGESPC
jgi:hypothetical protein